MIEAPARVVASFQPVSSRNTMPLRSSSARMRRTRTRSCAISATGVSPRSTWAMACAAAAAASSSKPSQTAKAGAGSQRDVRGRARRAQHRCRSRASAPRRDAAATSPAGRLPPATTTTQAAGRSENRRSLSRRAGTCRPFERDLREQALPRARAARMRAGSRARASTSRLARRAATPRPPSGAGAPWRRRAPQPRANPRGSRRDHSAPQGWRASVCTASRLSWAIPQPSSPEPGSPAGRAMPPGSASFRSAASRCRAAAKARRAGASSCRNGHEQHEVAQGKRVPRRPVDDATRHRGPGRPRGSSSGLAAGYRRHRRGRSRPRLLAGALCQNHCALRARPCSRSSHLHVRSRHEDFHHDAPSSSPTPPTLRSTPMSSRPARRCWSTTGPNGAARAR